MIDFTNETSIALSLVYTDRYGPLQSHTFDSLVQRGFRGFCVQPRGQSEIDHLAICVDGAL